MSKQSITNYYNKLSQYKRYGGTQNESSIRRAFANLLEEYCISKNLILVDEISLKETGKRPDGAVQDAMVGNWGYWESKDEKDDLDKEIQHKIEIAYPTENILFENSKQAVLFQRHKEIMRIDMQKADDLHDILTLFLSYQPPVILEFYKAIEKFAEDVPEIVEVLRVTIAKESKTNKRFVKQRNYFKEVCKESINTDISDFDIREMLIQHILTAEIFTAVFSDAFFHKENNIAIELENVVNTFFTGANRRNTLSKIDTYYKVIRNKANNIANHHEKQKFLKVLYESFYKAYNPKGADRLGVVYTPNEIVRFMIESSDYLLEKHFNRNLHNKNVQILDPATGTGTFITELIEYIPQQYLEHKYKNEIYCNEVAILPYYIANLNIEYTYQQKMQNYVPFENIVFIDTLNNIDWFEEVVGNAKAEKYYKNGNLWGSISKENLKRIKRQTEQKISLVIGNPPYNANQMNENDNNKNLIYPFIDQRIKDTYIKESTAQKTKVYDMYARFYRWASDRIGKNGIVSFITNRSFINSRTFDGFRKSIKKEFDYCYILDTKSDVRQNPKIAGTTHNVFGIQTGVAMMFLIKNKETLNKNCIIEYFTLSDEISKKEKLEFFQFNSFQDIAFERILPDKQNNWINLTDNDFETLLPVASKETKFAKKKNEEQAIFKLFSNGIVTARDEWVYDFNKKKLQAKVKFFMKIYNSEISRWQKSDKTERTNDFVDRTIKWTSELENYLTKSKRLYFSRGKILSSLYRPFVKRELYFQNIIIHRKYQLPSIFGKELNKENKVIGIMGVGINRQYFTIAVDKIIDLQFIPNGQSLPFYRYDKEGNRQENITDWSLKKFTEHYKTSKISKLDIFYYTYGVLHNPAYRKKYEINLKREFPRLPFYKDFLKWTNWGKKLMDLHINYESVKPYKLQITKSVKLKKNPKVKLRRDKNTNEILLDENTSILNIPDIAFEYKLGNRSAIDWILDQYKEKKPRDKTIREKFNTYRFADYKEHVIDLIHRVTTVSIKTMEIVNQMETKEPHINK